MLISLELFNNIEKSRLYYDFNIKIKLLISLVNICEKCEKNTQVIFYRDLTNICNKKEK